MMCLATALLVGLAPGLRASRQGLTHLLNSGGSRLVQSRRLREAFVVAQVGLALVLLVCAGLVGRSFRNLMRIDIGFDPRHVLTLEVTLPNAPRIATTHSMTALLARVRTMPSVEAAGAVFLRPLEYAGIGQDAPVLIEGQRPDLNSRDWEQNPLVNLESVTPGYFRAVGLPIVRGRSFDETDTARAPRVAIVSERPRSTVVAQPGRDWQAPATTRHGSGRAGKARVGDRRRRCSRCQIPWAHRPPLRLVSAAFCRSQG